MRPGAGLLAGLTALALLGCGDEGAEEHGYVRIRLRAADAGPDPFAQTQRVRARMSYAPCVIDYLEESPEAAADGPNGSVVFDTWKARLCALDGARWAQCTVAQLTQNLADGWLEVTYDVTDLAEGQQLAFGPLPRSSLTGCEESEVLFGHGDTVVGTQGEGEAMASTWEMIGAEPLLGDVDQTSLLHIDAARIEPADQGG